MKPFTFASFLSVMAQAVGAQPAAFDVASVKLAEEPDKTPAFCISGPCAPGERFTVTGSRVDIRYMSLRNLILKAYRLQPHQLSGPEWMQSQRFDIAAKMPEGGSQDRVSEMLQALLAARFKLELHREGREQPVLALVAGPNGARLRESKGEPEVPAGGHEVNTPQGQARRMDDGTMVLQGGPYGAIRGGRGPTGAMRWEFLNLTMPELAALLTPHTDRPVIDRTNLKGSYYLASDNRPPSGDSGRKGSGEPDAAASGARVDPFGDGLLVAIDKAGLKLQKTRAPVETVVIDRLEKTPTAN